MALQDHHTETDEISLSEIIEFVLRIKYLLFIAAGFAAWGAYHQRASNPRFLSQAIVQVQKSTTSPMQALSEKLSGLGGNSATAENPAENTQLFFISQELYRHVAKKILTRSDSKDILLNIGIQDLTHGTDLSESEAAFQSEALQMTVADRLAEISGAEVTSRETIRIWVKANSPDTTIAVANLLLDEGIERLVNRNLSELNDAALFIETKLQDLETEIKSRQDEVLDLRKKIGLSAGQMQLKDLGNPMNRLRETLANAETELRQRVNLINEMKPRIQTGQGDYSYVTKYEKLEDEKKFWSAAIHSLRATLKDMEQSNKGSSSVEQNMLNVNREIEFQYRFYGDLKSQLLQTEMMKISILNRVRALEPASASSTYKSSGATTYLFVAALLAIIMTTLIIYVLESAYPAIRNRHSLHSMPISFLGEIPDFDRSNMAFFKNIAGLKDKDSHLLWKSLKSKRIFDSPETMIFRALRSKLLHLQESEKGGVRVISITSPRPESGKTLITANLGCLLSIAKKKTLLIDCDIRRGGLTNGFELQGRPGLSDCLQGSVTDWKTCIESYTDDLHVMPRGKHLLNPAELLASDQLSVLLEDLKKEYDFILLDSSSILGIAETDIVTKCADMVLLALVKQETKMIDLKYTMEQLNFNDIKKIGYVLNRSGKQFGDTFEVLASKAA